MGVAGNLIPEEGTLGVRIPDHAFCQRMLRGLGRPIVSTSANISGRSDARRARRGVARGGRRCRFRRQPPFRRQAHEKASAIIAFGEGGEVKIIRE
ncbi:MAG: L-threonylcarbamoyladenylate synthase [Alistipes onderdonkii]